MLINLLVKINKEEVHSASHCERIGADVNHWPFQCTCLNQIPSDWHADQNATGHQNQSQNLNS